MNSTRMRSCAGLAGLLLLACPGSLSAARKTDVPNNFLNVYMGFTSVNNTNIRTTGNDSTWIGTPNNQGPFTLNMNNLKQENNVWGGFGGGHWFTQAPVSLGLSGSMDFFSAVVKQQTTRDFSVVINGVDRTGNFTSFTKYRTEVVQMVPAVNFLIGVPLKFARIYGGIGPGLFVSFYSFTMKNAAGKVTGTASASDAKFGYNALAGADFFISRRWSVFVEGKVSEVRNLSFTPPKSQVGGRVITDRYSSIKTQRLGIGGSFHF